MKKKIVGISLSAVFMGIVYSRIRFYQKNVENEVVISVEDKNDEYRDKVEIDDEENIDDSNDEKDEQNQCQSIQLDKDINDTDSSQNVTEKRKNELSVLSDNYETINEDRQIKEEDYHCIDQVILENDVRIEDQVQQTQNEMKSIVYDIGNSGLLFDSEEEAIHEAEKKMEDYSDPQKYVSHYLVYSTYDKWTISYEYTDY